MRKLCKLASLMLSLCISFVIILPVSTNAENIKSVNSKILIIVSDINEFDNSLVLDYEGQFDIVKYEELKYSQLESYAAYAVQSDLVTIDASLRKTLQHAFRMNDSKVYLYGHLTISDYKKAMSVVKFGAYVDIYDQFGVARKKAFMTFSPEQENSNLENIISASGSQTGNYLIANLKSNDGSATNMDYIKIILQDYCSTQISLMSVVLVKSNYNFRSYYNSENYITMDYRLYQDTDEIDPYYDYFAVKTNVCTENNSQYNTDTIEVKHSLPFSVDEMIDYGPGDITRADSVSVGLDFSSCSLGYSFEVGGGPTIDATYSAANDYCNWNISRYFLAGGWLQNNLFSPGTSWASTGTYAAVDVNFRAIFKTRYADYYTSWKNVQIRYDYV